MNTIINIRHIYIICLVFLLIVVSGCESSKDKKDIQIIEAKADDKQQFESGEDIQSTSLEETTVEFDVINNWDKNDIVKKYNLSSGDCKITSLTAPAYVNQNGIYFIDDLATSDSIIHFDQNTNTCNQLYKTSGIGNIVGIDDKLFWTEYDTTKITEVSWEIKQLDINNSKVTTLGSGESFNGTPTPALKTGEKLISWIEYKTDIQSLTVFSNLVIYNISDGEITTIENGEVDESNVAKGEYFIQQDSKNSDSFLLYKSIFKNAQKKFNLSLSTQSKKDLTISERDQIIDFSFNDNYVAYAGEGYLEIIDQSNPEQKIKFDAEEMVTLDTPIFINSDTLVFRKGISDIYIANIDKKIASLISAQISTSKPIYTNGILAFGVYNSNGDAIDLDFYVIDMNE